MTSTEDPRRALGLRIRRWRQRRHISQANLAERTGVTQSTLSKYENGRREPSVSILVRLAEELEVDLEDLVGRIRRRSEAG